MNTAPVFVLLLLLLCVPASAQYNGGYTTYELGFADGYQGQGDTSNSIAVYFSGAGLPYMGQQSAEYYGAYGAGYNAGVAERQRVAALSTNTGGTSGGDCVTSAQGAALIAAMYSEHDVSAQSVSWQGGAVVMLLFVIVLLSVIMVRR